MDKREWSQSSCQALSDPKRRTVWVHKGHNEFRHVDTDQHQQGKVTEAMEEKQKEHWSKEPSDLGSTPMSESEWPWANHFFSPVPEVW